MAVIFFCSAFWILKAANILLYRNIFQMGAIPLSFYRGKRDFFPHLIKIGRKNFFYQFNNWYFLSKLRILVESPRPQKVLLIQYLNQGFFFSIVTNSLWELFPLYYPGKKFFYTGWKLVAIYLTILSMSFLSVARFADP